MQGFQKRWLVIALAAALAACGGGGDDAPAANSGANNSADAGGGSTTPVNSNTGSVSAAFVQSANGALQLTGGIGFSSSIGNVSNIVQASDGAVTQVNSSTLAGNTVVKEISGDTHYAQGRWAGGTATLGSTTTSLSGTGSAAVHYVVFNKLAAIPTSGTLTCDSGRFTAPSYIGGNDIVPGSGVDFGTSTGSMSVTFSTSGAAVSGYIQSTVGTATGNTAINGNIAAPGSTMRGGQFFTPQGAGSITMLGDAGEGAITIATLYRTAVSTGAIYQGVASFTCR